MKRIGAITILLLVISTVSVGALTVVGEIGSEENATIDDAAIVPDEGSHCIFDPDPIGCLIDEYWPCPLPCNTTHANPLKWWRVL